MADKTLPPVAIGDSLAVGMRDANKIPGLGRVGAGPREVLEMIKRFSMENSLSGRDVFIGTGMPNIPEQKKFIEEQIDFVKKQGGNPILMGVGPGTKKKPTTGQNEFLAGLAERKGLPYMGPLANSFPDITKDPMGLHLRGPQYQQLFKQYTKPQPTQQQPQPQVQPESRAPRSADLLSQFTGAVMQAESLGKRYDKSGKLLTSKAGAMGEMQVMPGTVRDPGFGVKPARDNSPDELARVGRDYAATMLRRYNNDPTAAAVAYNWGPGNADKWVKRGADFGALPKETQQYVTRITGQMGIPIAAKRAPAPKRADVPPVPPQKRADVPPVPPQKRAQAEVFAPGATLDTGPRTEAPPQDQITRADVDRLGPNYQAALAAMSLADSREDDDDYDDDETIAERYMERRGMDLARQESTIEEEEAPRVSPLAGLSEITYQSPFAQQQPVMMAEGGEAKSMLRRMYEGTVPAQVRLFAETALMPEGKRAASTITERDFSDEEQRQILDTIGNARRLRMEERGLTMYKDPKVIAEVQKRMRNLLKDTSKASKKDFDESQRKRKAEDKYFLSGKGAVFYGDYPQDNSGRLADTTLGKSGAVRNTLGRFTYQTMPDGRINIQENYDFADDLVEGLNQRPSAEYEGMSTGQKLNALLMDTLHNPQDRMLDTGTKFGRSTLPGRVGSAFIGEKGRPVNVTIDPRELMPGYAGYADGGEIVTGGITPDTLAAFRNYQAFNPREALAALKRIGKEGVSNLESLARGSVAGVPGVVGDVESVFRDDKARRFATSQEIERQYLPKRMSAPTKESAGFTEIGTTIDPSIAAKVAKPTAKAALKAMKSAGPQIESTLMKAAPAAQPMYAVKPKGGVFYPQGSGSKMDDYLDRVVQQVGRNAPNIAGKDAQKVADFIQNKGRKYLTTTYGTGSDPVREAILEGRLILTGDDAEKIRGYALRAAREGSPEALKDVERAYDSLTEMRGNLMLPNKTPWMDAAGKRTAAQELESAKMAKEGVAEDLINPSVTSKEMEELQRTYSSESEKMLAALMAGERGPVIGAEKAVMMAAEKGEPIYDLSTGATGFDILNPKVVAQGIATIPVADLERMSFPEAVIRGAQNTLLERSSDAVVAAVEKGKSIPQKFYTEGVTPVKGLEDAGWVTVDTPFAAKLEGAAMRHSVSGYADVGSYGHGGREALLSGKAKVFSLRSEAGKPSVTVEARVDPEGLYISQVKGPYNSLPTPAEKRKVFELFDTLRPYDFKSKKSPEQYSRTRTGETITENTPAVNWAEEYSTYQQYRNKGAE
jgi:hypothetical protein